MNNKLLNFTRFNKMQICNFFLILKNSNCLDYIMFLSCHYNMLNILECQQRQKHNVIQTLYNISITTKI